MTSQPSPGIAPRPEVAVHEHDPSRCDQPNRWLGGDTCECRCACRFLALGHFFDKPLCSYCAGRSVVTDSGVQP